MPLHNSPSLFPFSLSFSFAFSSFFFPLSELQLECPVLFWPVNGRSHYPLSSSLPFLPFSHFFLSTSVPLFIALFHSLVSAFLLTFFLPSFLLFFSHHFDLLSFHCLISSPLVVFLHFLFLFLFISTFLSSVFFSWLIFASFYPPSFSLSLHLYFIHLFRFPLLLCFLLSLSCLCLISPSFLLFSSPLPFPPHLSAFLALFLVYTPFCPLSPSLSSSPLRIFQYLSLSLSCVYLFSPSFPLLSPLSPLPLIFQSITRRHFLI